MVCGNCRGHGVATVTQPQCGGLVSGVDDTDVTDVTLTFRDIIGVIESAELAQKLFLIFFTIACFIPKAEPRLSQPLLSHTGHSLSPCLVWGNQTRIKYLSLIKCEPNLTYGRNMHVEQRLSTLSPPPPQHQGTLVVVVCSGGSLPGRGRLLRRRGFLTPVCATSGSIPLVGNSGSIIPASASCSSSSKASRGRLPVTTATEASLSGLGDSLLLDTGDLLLLDLLFRLRLGVTVYTS